MADTRRLSTSSLWVILLNQKWKRSLAFMPLPGKKDTVSDLAEIPAPPGPRRKATSLPKCKGAESEGTSVSFPVKLTSRKTAENVHPTLLRNQYELEMGLCDCKLAPCLRYLVF